MKVDLGKVEVRAELRQAGRKAERIPAQVRQVYYSQVHSAHYTQVRQVYYSQVGQGHNAAQVSQAGR